MDYRYDFFGTVAVDTTEQIVKIYDYLHKLGGPKGIRRFSCTAKRTEKRPLISVWKEAMNFRR